MPLYIADGSIDHITLQKVPERFLIFYSSIVDGQMWCQECRAVENLVKETFSESGPAALIVYVGDKTQWKTSANIYRYDPWNITNIPTIVRLKESKEDARLGDETQILQGLSEFVKV